MTYYHFPTSTERARLPGSARLLGGGWIMPHAGVWPDPLPELRDWVPVIPVARPVDTSTDWTRTLTVNGRTVTETWTARPWTAEELAAQAAEVVRLAKAATLSPAAVTWLRDQAATAAATTATSGNAVAVLNGVLDVQAIFLDRLADLLEAHGFVRE